MTLNVIPAPLEMTVREGFYALGPDMVVTAPDGPAARFLTSLLRRATGFPVLEQAGGSVVLSLDGGEQMDDEEYLLEVDESGIRLRARTDEGLFRGVQTLRQLLPAAIESPSVQPGPWNVPAVLISDKPRFPWRGAMLDVARHFFDVATVKRFIDRLVPYKLNVLHLHLTDDQGWRLEIKSRPRLTEHGASTQVGGGPGGFFSQDDYTEIVAYAAERHLTVVPEVDLPGHTQAALSSYPALASEGVPTDLYTGTEVGFSELAIAEDETYEFLDEVLTEVASLTPGGFVHIGGDEALKTTPENYATFMGRTLPLVTAQGKRVIAWQEAASSEDLPEGAHIQYWRPTTEEVPSPMAGKTLIMSPADRAYLDLKYDESSPLGLTWAGTLGVRQSYDWDPGSIVEDVTVAGVEAALWTETIESPDDIDYMLYPRLPGLAEVAWSAPARDWDAYRARLRAQTARWDAAGITGYFRSPEL